MICAKCNRPLPVVKRRLEPGGEWVDVEWSQYKGMAEEPPGTFVCGYPGCEKQGIPKIFSHDDQVAYWRGRAEELVNAREAAIDRRTELEMANARVVELKARIDKVLALIERLERKWNSVSHTARREVPLYVHEVDGLRRALEGEDK